MKTGQKGVALIQAFEGYRKRPYLCPAKLWTVGYGTVLYPAQIKLKLEERPHYPLSPEHNREFNRDEIDTYLLEELSSTERGVARLCPASVGNQNQFDALVSFAYNCGLGALQRSTLRAKYNRGEIEDAAEEFLKYTRGGGKVLPGLIRRRNAEKQLFLA